jgi:DNA polymerase I-like protein with 3'-5' exonuclease and polymerase domains
LGISYEDGDRVYNAYMDSFPGLKNFFKRAHFQANRDGYILFNPISRRKSFIAKFDEYKALEQRLDSTFWTIYRDQKQKETEYFFNELKPIVRQFYKTKGKIERNAQNYKIQGTSSDITKLAGVYFYQYLLKNNLLFSVKISNIVHDEYVTESPVEIAEETAKQLKYSMESAGDVFCKIIKLKAEPVITKEWQH